ncbi:MaoC family dehydratase [Allostella humosa]|nr:MaoC/PaaZ C-terminal domain-containing protein [Stella humosa]
MTAMSPQDLHFEDVVLGETFVTPAHTVTDEAITRFADVTLDHSSLHLDDALARSMGFPRRIAHGLYGLSLMEGLKSKLRLYDQTSIASLGWDRVRFRAPILSGDTVRVRFAFVSKRESSKPDRGVVIEAATLERQDGTVLVEAEHATLLRRRGT